MSLLGLSGQGRAEQAHAGDGKQAPLVPRSTCLPRLMRGVQPRGVPLISRPVRLQSGRKKMDRRITIDPKVCHGQACIKGTRIPVYQILRMLAHGDTIEELLEEYPSLTREDILACLDYAASLAEEQVTPLEVLPGEA